MTTRRMAARRIEKGRVNEKLHPQVEQVLQAAQVPKGAKVPIGGEGNEFLVVPQT